MERDLQSLLDMLQSTQIVMNYIADRSQAEFASNLQLQDVIIRRLMISGEVARRISDTARQSLTTIPGFAIHGMRNRLVHEYDELDLDTIWDTAVNNLPVLISELEKATHQNE